MRISAGLAALSGVLALSLPLPVLAQDSGSAQAPAPDRQSAAWLNTQFAFLAGLSAGDGWRSLEGLRWRYLEYAGSKASPAVSDTVTVHYEGRLTDGTVIDSSYARGEPATFPLGGLIPAWRIAIPKMGVGDVIELAAPPELAYGSDGKGAIPPASVLVFKVELIAIQE